MGKTFINGFDGYPMEVLLQLHGKAIRRGTIDGTIDDVHRVKATRSDVDDPGTPQRRGVQEWYELLGKMGSLGI